MSGNASHADGSAADGSAADRSAADGSAADRSAAEPVSESEGERWLAGSEPAGGPRRRLARAIGPFSRRRLKIFARSSQQQESDSRSLPPGGNSESVLWLDSEGRVASCNLYAEWLLGYRESEIVGRHFSCLFTAEDIQRKLPERELFTARSKGRAENNRWFTRKDGVSFWGSGVTTPLRNGTTQGYSSVIRDLTEQKKAQDALQHAEERNRKLAEEFAEANRRRDQFLAVLSHELRNPLTPILAAVQIMRQDRSDSPTQRQARNVIERQVRQLANLVDDLLDTQRFAAGKMQLRKEPIELHVVVERAVESARPLIEARGHQLVVSLPPGPIWLHADPTRLEQVFLNLLSNAAKYTRDGGRIAVTAERQGSEAVVTVEDSGIGIPSHLLNEIFEIFTQLDRSQVPMQAGLGIGLMLVKKLVEMHSGEVTVHSDGADRGSKFTVRLPSSMAAAPVAPLQAAILESASLVGGLRILIADDDKDTAKMLSLILTTFGNQVRRAHDGQEAIETAAAFAPDVMLMDIGMPKLDGCEVARQIRGQEWGRKMVLVALTGWGQEEDKQRSAAAGFDQHLLKPIGIAELQNLLASIPRHRW